MFLKAAITFSGDDRLKQLAFLKSLTLKMVELNVSSSV